MIGYVQIDTNENLTAEQYRLIENTMQGSFNTQLRLSSRYRDRIQYHSNKQSMTVIGLFLSGIFGVIGICSIINTQVSGILSMRIGYTVMQAVGMTSRQLVKHILRGNLSLCGLGAAIAIPLSIILTWLLGGMIHALTGFSTLVFVIGCILLLAVMFMVSTSIALVMMRFLNRKPVVERLREG